MWKTYEIYLTQKYIPKEEWQEIINTISKYNGYLKKWHIIMTIQNNQIRYYIKIRYNLPITLNGLESFLIKPSNDILFPKITNKLISIPNIGSNIIDLINYYEIKNKGKIEYLTITFQKLYENKIKSKINYYLKKNNKYYLYRALLTIPTYILSIDFASIKRFFYKSPPKYLDINKILHLLNSESTNSLLKIDTFPYLQGEFYLNQNSFNFDKHSVIFGSSGCGKSKFISLLINNIHKNPSLKQKYKIVVIDPHAALENDIGGLAKTIDFQEEDNIDLFINNDNDIIASTELLLDLFKSLLSDQFNSKLERVLRHSIYLLLSKKLFNFTNLRKLILDLDYRSSLLNEAKSEIPFSVIDFFLSDFNELKTKSYSEAISPLIGFIDEMEMLPVFNTTKQYDNFKDILKNNFLTLFSLDRTKLGDKITKTISGLIMQQLLTIIQKREIDEHIIFIVDEVAIIENPILSRFLSEARKYNLSLILAGQYFSQISEELQKSIFANVINYYIFRVSKLDANILVDNFNMKVPLEDTKERKIKILTELNNRECLVRIDSNDILLPAFKASTIDFKSIPRIKTIKEIIVNKEQEQNTKKISFLIQKDINLKDILKENSSSRKVINNER